MDLIDRQAAIKTLEKGLPSEPLKKQIHGRNNCRLWVGYHMD